MAESKPHILLIGGDGGYSGVPTYIAHVLRGLEGIARLSVMSDKNTGGYDRVAQYGAKHIEVEGLKTNISPMRWWRAMRGIAREIETQQPQIVWAHARMAVLLLRLVAIVYRLRGKDIPTMAITYHGLPFEPGHRQPFAALSGLVEQLFLRLCPPHHLFFLSAGAKERFQARMGPRVMARHTAHVIMNCSDLGATVKKAADLPGPRTIVMTGRAGYQKNYGAAARLLAHLPADYRFVICGGGTDTPRFIADFTRAAGLGALGQRVRFVGPVADVAPILAEADVFLLTSRYEGMPIAALEAFEAGLPLALANIPGVVEILETHPMASALNLSDPIEAAGRIERLTESYLEDPENHSAQIRAAWASVFSFEAWQAVLCANVAEMVEASKTRATDG